MTNNQQHDLGKVPAITLLFWIIKIAATTLGETGGDSLSMSMQLGYLVSTGIFSLIFFVAVFAQIRAEHFHPWLYWTTIVATTTVGTTLADFIDRSLGIGYMGGTLLLVTLLLASFAVWYKQTGAIVSNGVTSGKTEIYYWITIMFSQTLGTAIGDWIADATPLGYSGSAVVFSALLLIVIACYLWTAISRTTLFWIAFVLTRPLGAVVGDFFDKPVEAGGLAFSRYSASLILIAFITLSLIIFRQKPARI